MLGLLKPAKKEKAQLMKGGNEISVEEFGALGDAVQRSDFTITGNRLSASEPIFTRGDIGKIYSIARAGLDSEHLVGKLVQFIDARTMIMDQTAIRNVENELGSFGTDNMNPIQKAFDYVISKNMVLSLPAGTYLIGDKNPETNELAVQIKMTRPNQDLIVKGAGKNKTIIRELDGKTQRFGRYTKLFYHYLKDSPDVGIVSFSDLSFDKNGRSLTKPPKTLYEWEQAHCLTWAAGSREQSAKKINKIYLENIEIIDKIGAGINYSSGPTQVTSLYAYNITEKDFRGDVREGIKYGQRGDLEISCFSEDIKIDNCVLHYIQIEPVKRYSSDAQNKRVCKIMNSTIHSIEYTESDNKDPRYSRVELDNVISERFLARSITFLVKNSDIKIPELINSVDGIIKDTRIRIPYDKTKNKVKPVNCSFLRTIGQVNNLVRFENCSFDIESSDSTILPTGFALSASAKVKDLSMNKVIVDNCTFDERLQYSIDAYANGTWELKNNRFAGKYQAVIVGGYKDFVSDVTLDNNNYSRLKSGTSQIRLNNNNALWKLRLNQNLMDIIPSFILKKGSQGNLKKQIILNE